MLGCLGISANAAPFDEQRAAVAAAPATQPESAILSLLKAGIDEGKPTQAIAEARKWLRQNLAEDAMLLYQAGRAAELSGDASGAAALYQQYLKQADPKSEPAGLAVIAVHALLAQRLNDPGAAYSFNRAVGDRLAANVLARQHDQWYLAEARNRRDLVAVANRLHALIQAGVPRELLETHYSSHFLWLLQAMDGYVDQRGQADYSEEAFAACRRLAEAMTFDEEMALRLKWAVAVRAYNLARIAEKDAAPPTAEAKALLAKHPRCALWVQHGWAGGGNGHHDRSDPAKYWPHQIDAKMAPVVAAAAKLSPLELANLVRSWRHGHYADRTVRPLEVQAVRDYLKSNPKLMNSRHGVLVLEKEWNKLTPAEAKALAPTIAANSQQDASLIRAIAAGGQAKDFDKMADALLGPEAWRIQPGQLSRWIDQLWHYAGRPGGNEKRDQRVNEGRALDQQARENAPKKEATPSQQTALFKKLWADYRSGRPMIPGVAYHLKEAAKSSPDAVPELLRDRRVEAQLLARDTIADGIRVERYEPVMANLARRHAGGRLSELKQRRPELYIPHPLEPAFRKAVRDGLNRKDLDPWQLIAWINLQFPEENAGQVKLIQEVVKSPLWKGMPWEARFAAAQWFRKEVMTPAQVAMMDAADPQRVCRELLKIEKEPETEEARRAREKLERDDPETAAAQAAERARADIPVAIAALESTLEGLRQAPVRIEVPEAAVKNLAQLEPGIFADHRVRALMFELIDSLKAAPASGDFASRLVAAVTDGRDPVELHRAAAFIWEHLNRNHRRFPAVRSVTQSLVDEHPSAATALANGALDAFARHRGHGYFNRETDIPFFKAVRGNAAMKMGLIVIPVAKDHPAYPVYQSQGDWTTGNEESAWDLLDESWEAFLPVHRELSLPYLMWALRQVVYNRNESRQEELVKALLAWAREDGSSLLPEEKARIEIIYGDIALQRGQLRQAHEIYTRTQNNEAYKDLRIRHEATLRRAAAERLAKDFDGALQTLAELEMERIPGLWTEVRYARAEVHFDMEEFEDAKDDIDSILAREPNHADAKILLGKVQLKRQKLMEATEVELGSATGQDSLVPGEKLKVTLSDPTLAVSGAGTEVEVVVWATSGDREQFFLRQFGDQKTKFRGEVPTRLGAPAPDDGALQVIGDDEVFYAYSERFREKMNNLGERRGGPITIASDALLMASARKLLTEAEQRTADMEALMMDIKGGVREAMRDDVARARLAAAAIDAEARTKAAEITEEEFGQHLVNVAKPGNPVHVRVIDPDRSRTAGVDELKVSVSSSSGDSIAQVTLRETGTHTGWFEGSIPTTGAQALAFARNSEPGRNPNMVISPSADNYPAWRPVPTRDVTPEFKIDLNDNVAIGEMVITAAEEGARLKTFLLQTGMNEDDMTTVAVFPRNQAAIEKPWHPSVVVMNDTDHHHNRNERSVYDLGELRQHIERGWITQQYAAGVAGNVVGPSEAMTETIPGQVKWQRQNRHHNAHVVYRFRAYFHEPREVVRRFKVELGSYRVPQGTHPSVSHPPQFLLAVNGRPITDPEKPDRLDGEAKLQPGLHHFEIWATGWDCAIGFGRSVRLLANLDDPDTLVECPDAFFDPANFPGNSHDHRNAPATITANEAGAGFKVDFAPDSRTRLLRLVILDHEGAAPAINKLTLTGPEGESILPVAEDFATLQKNGTLEILTGDKISVRYVDDRFVTKTKERHERFLDVAFTNARVEFADMEPRFSSRSGKDEPYYEKLLRFRHGEPLSLAIHDADMDVSIEPDKVEVTLASEAGGERTFEAVETGDSTGIFKLVITPVTDSAGGSRQFQVGEAGTLTATYLDGENNRPGVPTERVATIEHAAPVQPRFLLSHAEVTPWASAGGRGDGMRALLHGYEVRRDRDPENRQPASERVKTRWKIRNTLLPADQPPEGGFAVVHGRRLYAELVAPQFALGTASSVRVYAQTDAGRRAGGLGPDAAFDINTPGTIETTAGLRPWRGHTGSWHGVPASPIYTGGQVWGTWDEPRTDRFHVSLPLVPGLLPPYGVLTREEREAIEETSADSRSAAELLAIRSGGLVARPGERVYLGFRYLDPAGTEQWLTASATVVTHPAFDIMQEDYRSPMTSAYVGETLNLRVVDLGGDTSDEIDTVSVLVQAKSGAKKSVDLRESGPHTGIFKAGYLLSYAEKPGPLAEEHDVRMQGFPVIYGDTVAARYTASNGIESDTCFVTISKGADGSIAPFSKQYEDEEIAMRTQFSLAEAYLEMAKRHRRLGEEERAEQEYASAKLLLSKAMDQFNDPATRAHAEYLLGTLTMEEALATADPETREARFRAALSRFMTVTGSYPQTLHASRAQYRIATVYEALQEPEIAAQEYVKLAYKYPDSEFLATSMARLGSHFLKKASAWEEEAKQLLARAGAEEDKDAEFEGQARQKLAEREYLKTASIFGRLQERFPDNDLAGQAGLRAGQAYMRAGKNQEAVDAFQRVIHEEGYDGPKVRAQAIYWTGMCYQAMRQEMAAYSAFKRLTYDFPESQWAAYARGQLSQERLLKLENELELERLQAEQER